MTTPSPGIYNNIPFEEYCSWDAYNNSSLGPALLSARHYQHSKASVREETSALSFGRLAHEGRLEPASVLDRYIVMPDLTQGILVKGEPAQKPKGTTEYGRRVKHWMETNAAGKSVVEQDEFDRLKGLLSSLWGNETSRRWFTSMGAAEVSLVWEDRITGVLCKCRIDKVVHKQLIADLKTTRDVIRFDRSIETYGYDRQAAFYLDGWYELTGERAQFGIAAVESDAPFCVRAAPMKASTIATGRQKYRQALQTILEAELSGQWQGPESPEFWELPAWSAPSSITVYRGGVPLEVKDGSSE